MSQDPSEEIAVRVVEAVEEGFGCPCNPPGDAAALLRRFTQGDIETIDSGCCGMAGAFGMMRDHRDISKMIAEQSLHELLDAEPDDSIVMAGTSCRHQWRDIDHRPVLHPIEVIDRVLRPPTR